MDNKEMTCKEYMQRVFSNDPESGIGEWEIADELEHWYVIGDSLLEIAENIAIWLKEEASQDKIKLTDCDPKKLVPELKGFLQQLMATETRPDYKKHYQRLLKSSPAYQH